MSIDRDQPYNELPLLPPKDIPYNDSKILEASLLASDAIGALRAGMRSDQHNVIRAVSMMSPLFVPEAVTSSGIENIATTNELVLQARSEQRNDVNPNEKEVLNYVDALIHGMEKIHERKILTTNDIIDIQSILEPTKRGLRKVPGTSLQNPVTKEVYYTPPTGERLIRDLLQNLEVYFNEEAPIQEIYARMAILHYQFEAIHPFNDGNGRTGRMLMPLYLMQQGRLSLPVLFISKYILENRDEYYQKLRAVTYENAWAEWILYIITATTTQAKYTSDILDRIRHTIEVTSKRLKQELPSIYSAELVNFIFAEPYFDVARFQHSLGISYATARKYLALLEESKLLVKKKQEGRNRNLYANPQYIQILKQT